MLDRKALWSRISMIVAAYSKIGRSKTRSAIFTIWYNLIELQDIL
jgi:hypothetical protein